MTDNENQFVGCMLKLHCNPDIAVGQAKYFCEVFSDLPSTVDLAFSMLQVAKFMEDSNALALNLAQPDSWIWGDTASNVAQYL